MLIRNAKMANIYGRIRCLQIEKVDNITVCLKPQIIYKLIFLRLASNHQSIVHKSEHCHNLSRVDKGTISGEVVVLYALPDLIMEEIVKFLLSTRKRRHIFIVRVIH